MALELRGGLRALVTGSSSGIGAALAVELAGRGVDLVIHGRRRPQLAAVAEQCRAMGVDVDVWECDLADLDAAVGGIEAWWDQRPLDLVVHNAGMPHRSHVAQLDPAELDTTMAVNFTAPARMTLTVLDAMIERGSGMFVFVSSLGGRLGIPHEAAYCASKFALCGFAESMHVDLADTPIEVRLVLPGPIDTDIWHRDGTEPAHYDGPLTPPAEVAIGICALVEGDRFEAYLPDLKSVAEFKTSDPDAYLAGAADMVRQAETTSPHPDAPQT